MPRTTHELMHSSLPAAAHRRKSSSRSSSTFLCSPPGSSAREPLWKWGSTTGVLAMGSSMAQSPPVPAGFWHRRYETAGQSGRE